MKRFVVLALFVVNSIGVSAFVVDPVDASEPDLETILARHAAALGGEARQAIDRLELTGIYAYNGLEHPLREHRVRPDWIRREIDGIQQYGPQRSAGDVQVRAHGPRGAWVGGADGSEPMTAENTASFLVFADFDSALVAVDGTAREVELVGTETLDGTEVIHLRRTRDGGEVEQWWLDATTYLPVRAAIPEAADITRPHTWHFDDWRDVGGIKLPFYVMSEEKIFSR
ncbi:MAG: hypothetical protein AAGD38_23890, partial [Acidobacteriota bacterium]